MFEKVPREVYDIISKIEDNGFEAYMVGGCVRDLVMKNEPHDYDICTSALPQDIIDIFSGEGMVLSGLKHGTVGIIRDKKVYEITTYRLDGDYSDGRHPDSVVFTDMLSEDLLRRDFTINAMAYNPKKGLCDLYGGREDIKKGIIRCVGRSEERFSEDALRILRAIRFASRFGFAVEEETKKSMQKLYPTIEKVSIERINTEFTKTLTSKFGAEYINEFRDIIAHFIPEIKNIFNQNIWKDTIRSISVSNDDVFIRLALFFTPVCKYYGGASVAKKILKRMRYSNEIIDTVGNLVAYDNFEISDSKVAVKKLLNKLGEENFDRLMKVRFAEVYSDDAQINSLEKMYKIKDKIVENEECFSIKGLSIDGSDLIKMGIKPGRQFGKILQTILDLVLEEKLENKEEIIIEYLKDNIQ